jgi:hypothetical protein
MKRIACHVSPQIFNIPDETSVVMKGAALSNSQLWTILTDGMCIVGTHR